MDTTMKRSLTATIGCLLLLLAGQEAGAGKVLVLSMQFGSHLNEFAAITGELLKWGHTVHVVLDENRRNPSQFKGQNVEFIYYKSPDKDMMNQKTFDDKMANAFLTPNTDLTEVTRKTIMPRFTYDCKRALFDESLSKRLAEEKYDIALADSHIPCYHLLTYKLDIPTVTVSTTIISWFVKTHPLVPYFNPCFVTKETNTFFNRLKTFFTVMMFERFIFPTVFIDLEPFKNYVPEKPYSSLQDVIMKTSKLYIFNKNGLIDCPTPSMQNIVVAAGLTTVPPKPLQADYKKYVSESPNGIIVVSFGSGIASFPKHIFLKFLNAFSNLKQNVVWRTTKTYDEQIPGNVKIVQWLPQNDLMSQSNVKLFITHCGNNGQIEALYHGVPMLGVPIFADQHENANRIMHKGYGLKLNIHDFTSEEMVKSINEIIDNPKYAKSIKKASEIHRSLPDPRKTSVFWIDHVMKYGGDHLQTALSDMNDTQFYMVDIFVFIFGVLFFIIIILRMIVKKIFRMLTKMMGSKEKTN